MSFADAIAWLLGETPVLRRVDLVLDAASGGGLNVLGVHLAPGDFDAFRSEVDTHLFCTVTARGGDYRGYHVRPLAAGDSYVEVQDPRGRHGFLEIGLEPDGFRSTRPEP